MSSLVFHGDQTDLVDFSDIIVMLKEGSVQGAEASTSKVRRVESNLFILSKWGTVISYCFATALPAKIADVDRQFETEGSHLSSGLLVKTKK